MLICSSKFASDVQTSENSFYLFIELNLAHMLVNSSNKQQQELC